MTRDPAKDTSSHDARYGEPAAQGANRTVCIVCPKGNADRVLGCLLTGLRTAQIDDKAVRSQGKMHSVDRSEFRAAEGSGVTD